MNWTLQLLSIFASFLVSVPEYAELVQIAFLMGCENDGIAVIKLIVAIAGITRVVNFIVNYRLVKVNEDLIASAKAFPSTAAKTLGTEISTKYFLVGSKNKNSALSEEE